MPKTVGNAAVNYSLDAFERESWEGKPWKKRKSKKNPERKLLIGPGSGVLRRSIQVIRTTPNSVTIV